MPSTALTRTLTVGSVLDSIQDLQRRESVYVHVVDYLQQFVSTDSHVPARGIKNLTHVEECVPEVVVDAVILELKAVMSKIQGETSKLRGQRLPETKTNSRRTK